MSDHGHADKHQALFAPHPLVGQKFKDDEDLISLHLFLLYICLFNSDNIIYIAGQDGIILQARNRPQCTRDLFFTNQM